MKQGNAFRYFRYYNKTKRRERGTERDESPLSNRWDGSGTMKFQKCGALIKGNNLREIEHTRQSTEVRKDPNTHYVPRTIQYNAYPPLIVRPDRHHKEK